MDKMLSHLSEESKQAAATTLVSPPSPSPVPVLSSNPSSRHSCPGTPGFFAAITNHLVTPPQPTSEEDLCPICYAHPISAIFRPCSHKSCK